MKEWEYKNGEFIEIDYPLDESEWSDWEKYMRDQGYRITNHIIGNEFFGISLLESDFTKKEIELLYPFIMEVDLNGTGRSVYIKNFPDVLRFLKEFSPVIKKLAEESMNENS